eukprot:gene7222-7435_t
MAMNKFPRTPHLAALGSGVTRDDLVMDGSEAAQFLAHPSLVIEEKVDGTNLAISFHGPDYQLHLQHRGRIITPGSESQYAKLQSWIDKRKAQLIAALGTRYVLYGEWLAAQHSVSYTHLPDLFLAFDVLDTTNNRFLCKSDRDIILNEANVWPVRCIAEGPLTAGLAGLTMLLLNATSAYCDGEVPVEGLYVRQEGSSSSKRSSPAAANKTGGGSSKAGSEPSRAKKYPARAASVGAGTAAGGGAMAAAEEHDGYLTLCAGVLALKGAAVEAVANQHLKHVPVAAVNNRRSRCGPSFHITVFTPQELQHLQQQGTTPLTTDNVQREAAAGSFLTLSLLQQLNHILFPDSKDATSSSGRSKIVPGCQLGSWLPLGLGQVQAVAQGTAAYYVIITWPAARHLRKILGLPDKDFHITLGFDGADVHQRPKGVESIVPRLEKVHCSGIGSPAQDGSHHQELSEYIHSSLSQGSSLEAQQVAAIAAVAAAAVQRMALQDPTNGGSHSSRLRLAVLTLLLAALQAVEGVRQPNSSCMAWGRYRTLSLAAAQLFSLQADICNSQPPSSPVKAATAAALWAVLARQEGRNGDVHHCMRLAETALVAAAADPAASSNCHGSAAYANMLLGKAHFKEGNMAAALAAFKAAQEAAATSGSLSISCRAKLGLTCSSSNAEAATEAWLQQTLVDLVDHQLLMRATKACNAGLPKQQVSGQADDRHAAAAPGGLPTEHGASAQAAAATAAAGPASSGIPLQLGDPRQKVVVNNVPHLGDVLLMRNTSWVIPGRLMGGSTPTCREHIAALDHVGVKLVITLTEEGPLPPDWFAQSSKTCSSATPVGDAAGMAAANSRGRGSNSNQGRAAAADGGSQSNYAPEGASARVRNVLVPVTNYEPPTVQQMDTIAGLVKAAGKSTFAAALESSCSVKDPASVGNRAGSSSSGGSNAKCAKPRQQAAWLRVCQDDCGSRAAAEVAYTNAMLRNGSSCRVVLDRCNATAQDRAEWLDLALLCSNKQGKVMKGVWAVHFDVPSETCTARVMARTNHPTIPQGRGRRAVQSFASVLQPPSKQEGFERAITVRTRQEVDQLLILLGASPLPASVKELEAPAVPPWQQWDE